MATLSAESRKKLSESMKRSHAERKRSGAKRAPKRPTTRDLASKNGAVLADQLLVIDKQIQDLEELKRLLLRHRALLNMLED